MRCYSSDDFESAPREKYTESIALLFRAKDERTKATPASFCARREKMCRPFPLKFGGKAPRRVATRALLSRTRQSLSLSHAHAVVAVVIAVAAVHAKLASAWPISAFSREHNREESGGGRHAPGDGFASKAYKHTEQNTRDDDVSRPRGVVAIVVQREQLNWARARFVPVGGAFYVCAVLWENDDAKGLPRWRWGWFPPGWDDRFFAERASQISSLQTRSVENSSKTNRLCEIARFSHRRRRVYRLARDLKTHRGRTRGDDRG